MSIVGGLIGQAGRNAVLEPWRGNTRAEDGATRAGELATDGLFIAGGGTGAFFGIKGARNAGGPLAKAGWTALAGVSAVAAATGVKNLFAKLPSAPNPNPNPTPNPNPNPTPNPTPDPKPAPDPTPDPKPDPKPQPKPAPRPEPPKRPDPKPAPRIETHVVRPGESLSFIADCYKVDWRDLYTFNRDVIGPNPDAIQPRTRLGIPPKGYEGGTFQYHPTTRGGILPEGLECLPSSPKAKSDDCDVS